MITIQAPAKVNLRLRVLARDETGFHALETLFCAISLCDELSIRPADQGVSLTVDGAAPTASPNDDLVVRAARRFAQQADHEGGLDVHLTKRIPAAAGLGGGSSDAAATLRALNALAAAGPKAPGARELLAIAAELGSDVPFFLCGSPLAWAWSRGENLLTLPPLPSRPLLVVHPRQPFPTADAFRRLADSRGSGYRAAPDLVHLRELQAWDGVAALATNDFQGPAVAAIPILENALEALRHAGAFIAMLAGSGASVFGIFHSDAQRDAAEPELAALGLDTWRARTLERMPEPTSSATSPRSGSG